MANFRTIATIIAAGGGDAALDAAIADLGATDPAAWRVENYAMLRRLAYPDMADYLDAQVKMTSGDSDLQAAGRAQLDAYLAACLAVKARFPKP